MSSRAGVIPKKGFNKVKAGGDQAFTLPYGTSAAPIMNVKYIPSVKVGGKTYTGTGGNPIKVTSHQAAGSTGQQTSGSVAQSIKLFKPKKLQYAKGGYAKKVRKPQKK